MSAVLNKIGSQPNSNHMFYPTSGGMDLDGAYPFENEPGCLALKTDDRVAEVVKPSVLLFECASPELEWAYFRLECEPLQPCGVYEDSTPVKREEVVLVASGTYARREAWDADEFQGKPLPSTAQLINRFIGGGPFVIFSKGSLYNLGRSGNFDAYNAVHAQMNAAQFRRLIEQFAGVA
jgi:serine/threonine-protein kinase